MRAKRPRGFVNASTSGEAVSVVRSVFNLSVAGPTGPSSPQSIESRIRWLVSIFTGFVATIHNIGMPPRRSLFTTWPSTGQLRIGEFDIHLVQKPNCSRCCMFFYQRYALSNHNTVGVHSAIAAIPPAETLPGLEQINFRQSTFDRVIARWRRPGGDARLSTHRPASKPRLRDASQQVTICDVFGGRYGSATLHAQHRPKGHDRSPSGPPTAPLPRP